jgi:hypothetical protein
MSLFERYSREEDSQNRSNTIYEISELDARKLEEMWPHAKTDKSPYFVNS